MVTNAPLILMIDDEAPIRTLLRAVLSNAGYRVAEAKTAVEAISLASKRRPSVVLLDLRLPDMEGLDVLRQMRQFLTAPIIILSARVDKTEKVTLLDAGADDYLTKPFVVEELLARIRLALRHAADPSASALPFKVNDLMIDRTRQRVFLEGKDVRMTRTEYQLLDIMAQHAGTVLTHEFLLKKVWGPGHADATQYLRVFIGGLRRKLESDPAQPRYLQTEQGIGYWLASE